MKKRITEVLAHLIRLGMKQTSKAKTLWKHTSWKEWRSVANFAMIVAMNVIIPTIIPTYAIRIGIGICRVLGGNMLISGIIGASAVIAALLFATVTTRDPENQSQKGEME